MTPAQGFYGHYYDNTDWRVPAGSGPTLAGSVAAWAAGEGEFHAALHVDQVEWPGNAPCSSANVTVAERA